MGKDNKNKPQTIKRQFLTSNPFMYMGEEYPSTTAWISDGNGNETEGTVFADANGQYYTTDSNGNAMPVMPVHTLDEVTVTGPKRYNALGDTFKKSLATKPKEYDTTLMGLASGVLDKLRGNNTYTYNPSDPGSVRPYNPDEVDWGKTRRSQNKVVNALSGTWGPVVSMAMAPALASSMASAPLVTMATLAGGAAGGYAADKASEALTGRDIGTNVAMYTPLSPDLGEMLNPGYFVGGTYGNFVGNNLAKRGRYTLNYLTPASYGGHYLDFPLTLSKPFYEKPPTFYNGRKPAWYSDYASKYGVDAAEQRFQNGLVWAGIPEKEAAHPMYIQNNDGSYRLAPEGIGYKGFSADALPDYSTQEADFFTRSGIGGEHSDYKELGDWMGAKLMQFEDEQKLNPQWMVTDKIKVRLPEDSKLHNFFDNLGGKPLDGIVGYKPFTIKQNYVHTGNKVYTLYDDPSNSSYIPDFTLLGK
jgi:hypothetical protein